MDLSKYVDTLTAGAERTTAQRLSDREMVRLRHYVKRALFLSVKQVIGGKSPDDVTMEHIPEDYRKDIADCAKEIVDHKRLRTPANVAADDPRVQKCVQEYRWIADELRVDPGHFLEETRKCIETAVNSVRLLNDCIDIEYHPVVEVFRKMTTNISGSRLLDARDDVEAPLARAAEAICREKGYM